MSEKIGKDELLFLNEIMLNYFNHGPILILNQYDFEKKQLSLRSLKTKGFIRYSEDLLKGEQKTCIKIELLPAGIAYLKYKKIKNKKWNNPHDQILYRCMSILNKDDRFFCFSDFELNLSRPDLYKIKISDHFEGLDPIAYEIKHSRSDFFKDIKNPEKRKSYFKYSTRLYYVCEKDLIKKEEVPDECGLIYLTDDEKMVVIKESKYNDVNKLTLEEKQSLLLTLIIRQNIYEKKIQIAKTQSKEFKWILTEKENARIATDSFSFNFQHHDALTRIRSKSIRFVSSMMKNVYEDLLFWDLIEIKNTASPNKRNSFVMKITNKGEKLLDELRKQEKERDEKEAYISLLSQDGVSCYKINKKYITIPLTKKAHNLKTTLNIIIQSKEEFDEFIKRYDENLLNDYHKIYLIVPEKMENINEKILPKKIGVMKQRTINNRVILDIKKSARSNKNNVVDTDLLLCILNKNLEKKGSDYLLFY